MDSVVAMYHRATGEPIYGPDVDRFLEVHDRTPLPGVPVQAVANDGAKRAATPPVHGKHR